jgi:hypothetical protein
MCVKVMKLLMCVIIMCVCNNVWKRNNVIMAIIINQYV